MTLQWTPSNLATLGTCVLIRGVASFQVWICTRKHYFETLSAFNTGMASFQGSRLEGVHCSRGSYETSSAFTPQASHTLGADLSKNVSNSLGVIRSPRITSSKCPLSSLASSWIRCCRIRVTNNCSNDSVWMTVSKCPHLPCHREHWTASLSLASGRSSDAPAHQ